MYISPELRGSLAYPTASIPPFCGSLLSQQSQNGTNSFIPQSLSEHQQWRRLCAGQYKKIPVLPLTELQYKYKYYYSNTYTQPKNKYMWTRDAESNCVCAQVDRGIDRYRHRYAHWRAKQDVINQNLKALGLACEWRHLVATAKVNIRP